MFGQLCVEPDDPDELPGLAEVDGDALADGEALAAWTTAKVLRPPPNARAPAITTLAIRLCAHAVIAFTSLGDGSITAEASMRIRAFQKRYVARRGLSTALLTKCISLDYRQFILEVQSCRHPGWRRRHGHAGQHRG
jgi:hypothetical protein